VGITHAPDLEQALVDAGWTRMPFMKNYFYLVGPKDDPAAVKRKRYQKLFRSFMKNNCLSLTAMTTAVPT